jgi:hypothetical protein
LRAVAVALVQHLIQPQKVVVVLVALEQLLGLQLHKVQL